MQINWHEFLSYKFWFKVDRVSFHSTDKAFLVIGALLLITSLIIFIYRAKQKNPYLHWPLSSLAHNFLTIGVLELLWFGIRFQYADVISTRIVALVILVFGLFWMIWPVKYFLTKYRSDKEMHQKQLQKDKYLK